LHCSPRITSWRCCRRSCSPRSRSRPRRARSPGTAPQVEPYAQEFKGLDEVGIGSLSAARAKAFLAGRPEFWPKLAGWKLARFFRLTGEVGGRPWRSPIAWSWGLLAPFALIGFVPAATRPRRSSRC